MNLANLSQVIHRVVFCRLFTIIMIIVKVSTRIVESRSLKHWLPSMRLPILISLRLLMKRNRARYWSKLDLNPKRRIWRNRGRRCSGRLPSLVSSTRSLKRWRINWMWSQGVRFRGSCRWWRHNLIYLHVQVKVRVNKAFTSNSYAILARMIMVGHAVILVISETKNQT